MRLLFTLMVAALHCTAQDSVRVSGTITAPVSDSIAVTYNVNPIAYYPQTYYAKLDRNNSFRLSFPVINNVYTMVTLSHGRNAAELIVQPGDDLIVSANGSRFDSSLHFTGTGSDVANFLARHRIERGVLNRYSIKLKTSMNREPALFLKEIGQERQLEMAFLEKNGKNLSPAFAAYWKAYFLYYNYFFIQQYPQLHEMIRRRSYTDTVPEANYAVLKEMPDAFDDKMLQVPSYLLYLTGVLDIRLKASGFGTYKDPRGHERLYDSVMKLAYSRLPSRSAEYFIAQNLYGRARRVDPAETESYLAAFRKRWPRSTYTTLIEDQLAVTRRLDKGQPAPDIDITGEDGVRKKLSDLRGKVVYLSFWASWCKQCVGEFVGQDKVKDLLKDKPVVFVYVSLDDDVAAFHKVLEKFAVSGMHTRAGHGWSAKEVQQYGIQSLPAYFLIDQDGNFAERNAPSPANGTQLAMEITKAIR